jgi:hypothetical protein
LSSPLPRHCRRRLLQRTSTKHLDDGARQHGFSGFTRQARQQIDVPHCLDRLEDPGRDQHGDAGDNEGKAAMTPDERLKLQKELIAARDR